ncbi:hypothetical protein BDZ97DRAFT_1761874 [Flammula alnicola]|nr:hypothetical protein BDZ97DRAFT_1761874 [Flammula alnicola]
MSFHYPRLKTPTYVVADGQHPVVYGFWSPNARNRDFPRTIPERGDVEGNPELEGVFDHPRMEHMRNMQWLLKWDTRNACVPLNPNYDSTFLSSVNYTPSNLPVERVGLKYRVDPSLVDKWYQMEHILLRICDIMPHFSHRLVPLTAPPHIYPSNLNFQRQYDTEGGARYHGCRVITRMHQLFGEAAHCTILSKDSWTSKLPRDDPVTFTPRVMQELSDSLLLDFYKVKRVGALVDVNSYYKNRDEARRPCFKRLVDAGVPLFFLYVTANLTDPLNPAFTPRQMYPITRLKDEICPAPNSEKFLKHYNYLQPSPQTLQAEFGGLIRSLGQHLRESSNDSLVAKPILTSYPATEYTRTTEYSPLPPNVYSSNRRSLYHPPTPNYLPSTPFSQRIPSPNLSPSQFRNSELDSPMSPVMYIGSSVDIPSQSFPPSIAGSGQPDGLEWYDFFAERRAILQLHLSEGNEKRLLEAPVDRNSVRFFRWVPQPEYDGFALRVPILPRELDDHWEYYDQSQRLYDPVSDEWDLCDLLPPNPHIAWSTFFHDRDVESRKATDDQRDITRRLEAERVAESFNSGEVKLTKKSVKKTVLNDVAMFLWDVDRAVAGGFRRKQQDINDFVQEWGRHKSFQRIYNSVHHEWDLCCAISDKDGSGDADMDYSSDEEPILPPHFAPRPLQNVAVGPVGNDFPVDVQWPEGTILQDSDEEQQAAQSSNEKTVERSQKQAETEEPSEQNDPDGIRHCNRFANSLLMRDNREPQRRDFYILVWLSMRYGFVKPKQLRRRSVVQPDVQKKWIFFMGLRGLELGDLEKLYKFDIEYFADCLRNPTKSPSLLGSIFDLRPENESYLDPSRSLIHVDKVMLERAGRMHPCWFMAVEEATSVVMAIREKWGKNLETLVKKFQEFGIPFRTFQVQKRTTRAVLQFESRIHLLKAPDRDFNLTDYVEYEDEREKFFSSPRGRGVIGLGGVIRRLYQLNDAEQARRLHYVMQGPTERAALDGDAFIMHFRSDSVVARSIEKSYDTTNDAKEIETEEGELEEGEMEEDGNEGQDEVRMPSHWRTVTVHDDTLSIREQEFVLGVYDTSNVPHYDKPFMRSAPRPSWFPHPDVFVKNHFGNNGGIWDPNEEKGFRIRLRKIVEDQKAMSKTEQKLSITSASKQVDETYEKFCQEYLVLAGYVHN